MAAKNLKILSIVGARSGSKGIPHKNIRPLAGKPLLGWIIEAASASKYVNRVIVSTDSPQYADIARQYGAEVPCLRPAEIAQDHSLDIEYIRHMIDWLRRNEGYNPDIVLRLLPTAPLQLAEDIDGCLEKLLADREAHSAVVIAQAQQHPAKALRLAEDGKGGHYIVDYATGRGRDVTPTYRQKYEPAYFRANVIATRVEVIDKLNSLTGDRVCGYVIPVERAIDIDSETDFLIAEMLIKKFKSGE